MASYRLAIRRDTAANWSASNPVLAQGEFGYEADTGSLKIGDGVTQWNSLAAYTSIAGADLDNLGDVDTAGKVVGDVLKWDGVSWSTAADNDTIYADADVDTHLNVSTATTNDYLKWDGADYEWATVPAGYADADVDTHLNTGTALTGEVLSWTGSDYDWIAAGGSYGDADVDTNLNTGTALTGEVLSWTGSDYDWIAAGGSYGDADVDTNLNTGTATDGQVLSYVSGDYDWVTVTAGYADADVDTHLNTGTATANQILSWTGSDYAWTDDQTGGGGATGPLPELLLKGDVSVTQDDSLNGYTFATTGAAPTVNTSDKQFGAGSMSFPSTTKITTNENINFGNQPFCIEAWLKPVSVSGTQYWGSKPPVGNFCWFPITNGVPQIEYGATRSATSSLSTSAWNHVAYVHDGTNLKIYFNGTEEHTSVASYDLGDYPWAFGGTDSGVTGTNWYNGLIDDLRVTVGDPVYTGNFTPAEHSIPVAKPLGEDETDVTITSPSNGQVLEYNGTNWVNVTPVAMNPDTGVYVFPNLPTSDPVNAGQLWNDAGTLKVSAG